MYDELETMLFTDLEHDKLAILRILACPTLFLKSNIKFIFDSTTNVKCPGSKKRCI